MVFVLLESTRWLSARTPIVDHLDDTVADAQSGGEQLYESCVHARDHRDLFVRQHARSVLLVFFIFDKAPVVLQHLPDFVCHVITFQ